MSNTFHLRSRTKGARPPLHKWTLRTELDFPPPRKGRLCLRYSPGPWRKKAESPCGNCRWIMARARPLLPQQTCRGARPSPPKTPEPDTYSLALTVAGKTCSSPGLSLPLPLSHTLPSPHFSSFSYPLSLPFLFLSSLLFS